MPKFTIERTFDVPHYRHATYDAPDLAAALKMDEENDDWENQEKDYDTSGPERVTGAWAGEQDYVGPNIAPERPADVLIEVSGGVAEVTRCADGITVEIIDHDNLDAEADARPGVDPTPVSATTGA